MTNDHVPKSLKGSARKLWIRLREDFEISDAAGLGLLEIACLAYARMHEAREVIEKDGAVVLDRFGQAKANPAVAIERDAAGTMTRALRALHLSPDVIA